MFICLVKVSLNGKPCVSRVGPFYTDTDTVSSFAVFSCIGVHVHVWEDRLLALANVQSTHNMPNSTLTETALFIFLLGNDSFAQAKQHLEISALTLEEKKS